MCYRKLSLFVVLIMASRYICTFARIMIDIPVSSCISKLQSKSFLTLTFDKKELNQSIPL